MGKRILSVGGNTFQFFTKNPKGGKVNKPADTEDVAALRKLIEENGIFMPLAHAPYTYNPCSADEGVRQYSRDSMRGELEFLESLPGSMYNFHPGCHVKQGAGAGVDYISAMLIDKVPAPLSDNLGVCLDTCHVNDAGYDMDDLDELLEEFDRTVGLDRLCAIHLNDSMNERGSHKDRHAKIGEGTIGIDNISKIINHPKLAALPFYLETPNDLDGYAREISLLKELRRV